MALDPHTDPRVQIHPSCQVHWDNFELIIDNDGQFVAEEGCILRGRYHLMARETLVHFGRGSRVTNRCEMILAERGNKVLIGEDVSISGAVFRTSDGHPGFDTETGKRINPSGDIVLEDGVGVADRAAIIGACTIGAGAIVGFGAVVLGRPGMIYPPNCTLSGNPARPTRNRTWRDCFGDTLESPRTLAHRRKT